jgi:hypothetical protein
VRLIRSKGVGVWFVTQSPKDVPAEVLGQLGNRVQHALRAFTPDDDKALKAAARTFPRTEHYDVEETLTTLGTGEAFVTVLTPAGAPTPPFAVRMIPPAARMGPLTPEEFKAQLIASDQVKEYATPVDRDSAREMLAARMAGAEPAAPAAPGESAPEAAKDEAGRKAAEVIGGAAALAGALFGSRLVRDVARTATREVARGALGALLGAPPRRRTTRRRTTASLAGSLLRNLIR